MILSTAQDKLESLNLMEMMTRYEVVLINPKVIIGMFTGAMLAFVFSGITMKAVGRAAGQMVDEVRRQFREMPGIMAGTQDPDYARCVAISTKAAQREMMLPSILAIAAPVVIGFIFGVPGVLGLLGGAAAAGFSLSMFMANAGGAWDNAKKYIEEGHHGGKGSEAHKAAVIGDTVGDPFKDTSGPGLNILVKLMSMEAIVVGRRHGRDQPGLARVLAQKPQLVNSVRASAAKWVTTAFHQRKHLVLLDLRQVDPTPVRPTSAGMPPTVSLFRATSTA